MTSPGLEVCEVSIGCRRLLRAVLLPLLLAPSAFVHAAPLSDPLFEPAGLIASQVKAPLIDVVNTGEVLIGVGLRGLIQRSDDGGNSWRQMPSPVSSDLISVRFSDPKNGWIVGHDSLLLHTNDGGDNWQVQLDGRRVLTLLREWYGRRAEAGELEAESMLREINMAMNTSATPDVMPSPFLDVMFNDKGVGFVVGAFGMILHSRDNGATWEPWIERTENERRMHLYGLAEQQGVFYASGEQGLLMRLDIPSQRFVALDADYDGTFFGIRAFDNLLVAHGLRGNLFVSRDKGDSWIQIRTGIMSSLVDVVARPQEIIVMGQDGQMVAVDINSLKTTPLRSVRAGEVYAASDSGADRLVVAQFSGTRLIDVAKAD